MFKNNMKKKRKKRKYSGSTNIISSQIEGDLFLDCI